MKTVSQKDNLNLKDITLWEKTDIMFNHVHPISGSDKNHNSV
jgi:hypothetical protein